MQKKESGKGDSMLEQADSCVIDYSLVKGLIILSITIFIIVILGYYVFQIQQEGLANCGKDCILYMVKL
jgi:hypothetical protein